MGKKFNFVYSIIAIVYVVMNFVVGLIERVNLLIQTWKFVWRRRDRDSKFPILAKIFAIARAIRATMRFLIDVKTPVEVLGKHLMSTARNSGEYRSSEDILSVGRRTRLGLSPKYRHKQPRHGKRRG